MPQTWVITGANRGIGLAIARHVAARGDTVHAICRDAARMPVLDGSVLAHGAEVTDEPAMARIAGAIAQPVDVLVCNAGIFLGRGGFENPDLDADAWRDVLMTNVAGPFLTIRAFHAALGRARAGKAAIISSAMGSSSRAPGGDFAYRASKAAATNIACNYAAALRDRGIAVGSYHPGWVRTDMGGPSAAVGVEDSAAGLVRRIDALSLATSGVFEDFQGNAIPF